MGCTSSKGIVLVPSSDPNSKHPAVVEDWPLKEEAIRIFKVVDADGSGALDATELAATLKKPKFVDTVMSNYDLNMDGKVSLSEWLIEHKKTFDKSELGCKTALKTIEKVVLASREAE